MEGGQHKYLNSWGAWTLSFFHYHSLSWRSAMLSHILSPGSTIFHFILLIFTRYSTFEWSILDTTMCSEHNSVESSMCNIVKFRSWTWLRSSFLHRGWLHLALLRLFCFHSCRHSLIVKWENLSAGTIVINEHQLQRLTEMNECSGWCGRLLISCYKLLIYDKDNFSVN